ncbi:MAG: hypothetical protein QXU18_06650, partial [Thermoplasmatales archaeon]
ELSINLTGAYHTTDEQTGTPYVDENTFGVKFPWKLSQKEWAGLLQSIGYDEKWIIEIPRPNLEGFHEVIPFIEKAQKGLMQQTSPDAIISDLRSAWDRLDPYINRFESELKEKINAGSATENNQPSKDERIGHIREQTNKFMIDLIELRKSVDKLCQIGPHKEIYASTVSDALLSFRLTVSLMAFYSKLLADVENDMKVNGK